MKGPIFFKSLSLRKISSFLSPHQPRSVFYYDRVATDQLTGFALLEYTFEFIYTQKIKLD